MNPKHYEAERWEPNGGSYCPLSAYVMENHIPASGDSVSTTCQAGIRMRDELGLGAG